MAFWKKSVTDAGQKTATALLQGVQMKGELRKVSEKRNEFGGKLSDVKR